MPGSLKDFLFGAGTLRKASGEASKGPSGPASTTTSDNMEDYVKQQIARTKGIPKDPASLDQGASARSNKTTSQPAPTPTPIKKSGKGKVNPPNPQAVLAAPRK